jgi:uncharacterized membrane protein
MKSIRQMAQALVWFTVALPMLLSTAGLAIDGGVLLSSRRQLQSVADGAARAGATQLDVQRLRSTAGANVELDRSMAVRAAQAYLSDALLSRIGIQEVPSTTIEVTDRTVHVEIHATLRTAFLRIIHLDSVPVRASADASVQAGIRDGSGG